MGFIVLLAPAFAAAAGATAVGVMEGAIVGAVLGGVTAAIKGGDIMKGALIGGALGGVGGGVASAATGGASVGMGEGVANGLSKAVGVADYADKLGAPVGTNTVLAPGAVVTNATASGATSMLGGVQKFAGTPVGMAAISGAAGELVKPPQLNPTGQQIEYQKSLVGAIQPSSEMTQFASSLAQQINPPGNTGKAISPYRMEAKDYSTPLAPAVAQQQANAPTGLINQPQAQPNNLQPQGA